MSRELIVVAVVLLASGCASVPEDLPFPIFPATKLAEKSLLHDAHEEVEVPDELEEIAACRVRVTGGAPALDLVVRTRGGALLALRGDALVPASPLEIVPEARPVALVLAPGERSSVLVSAAVQRFDVGGALARAGELGAEDARWSWLASAVPEERGLVVTLFAPAEGGRVVVGGRASLLRDRTIVLRVPPPPGTIRSSRAGKGHCPRGVAGFVAVFPFTIAGDVVVNVGLFAVLAVPYVIGGALQFASQASNAQ